MPLGVLRYAPGMRSRLSFVLVVGLAVGLLSSCGGKPDVLTEKTLFSRLAAAQAKAETSHVSMNLTVPAGQSFRSYGEMKIGKSAEDTAMAMTVTGNTGGIGKVELRLVKQKFYISLGKLTSNKFVSIDLTDKSNPIAKQYGEIIENLDPARQVKQYQAAIVKFDNEGKPVKLHGVEAQPYKITIDPSKARQLKDMGAAKLPKTMDFTLFVGPDDLPLRMVSQIPAPDGSGNTKLQMDYTAWGEKVSIAAPSAKNITNDSLLNQLTGQ